MTNCTYKLSILFWDSSHSENRWKSRLRQNLSILFWDSSQWTYGFVRAKKTTFNSLLRFILQKRLLQLPWFHWTFNSLLRFIAQLEEQAEYCSLSLSILFWDSSVEGIRVRPDRIISFNSLLRFIILSSKEVKLICPFNFQFSFEIHPT